MTTSALEQAALLHSQITTLVAEVKMLRKEKDKLQSELEKRKILMDEMERQNKKIQSLLDVGTLSKAISIKQEPGEVRNRLNKLIKELDTVINYLEKT